MAAQSGISRLARATISAMPQRLARDLLFRHRFGYFPDLTNPQTFQEKLNYRIIFDRRDLLITASSKVNSKRYVEKLRIPSLHFPKTIWHGSDLEELAEVYSAYDWVLKPSHRSGAAYFGGPGYIPVDKYKDILKESLNEREYKRNKLWAYRHVTRELILEERLGGTSGLTDYKFFVFNGKVALTQVDTNRFNEHSRNLYDEDFKLLEAGFGVPRGRGEAPQSLLRELASVASEVGQEFDFARVDLYHFEGRTYFGELTMYPGGGLSRWPRDLDRSLGQYWEPFPPVGSQSRGS